MGRNKKWKREAKRLVGKSDLQMCECFFCSHSRNVYRYGMNCHSACNGQIRYVEKQIKNENIARRI